MTQGVLKFPTKNYDYKQEIFAITQPKDLAKTFVQACLSLSWQEQYATKNVTLSTYLPKQKEQTALLRSKRFYFSRIAYCRSYIFRSEYCNLCDF
jgi:hypothetical protein